MNAARALVAITFDFEFRQFENEMRVDLRNIMYIHNFGLKAEEVAYRYIKCKKVLLSGVVNAKPLLAVLPRTEKEANPSVSQIIYDEATSHPKVGWGLQKNGLVVEPKSCTVLRQCW